MAKGISLHVGINQVGPDFPNAAPLFGCENDAKAMHDLATLQGFYKHALLLGQDATYDRVIHEIEAAAAELVTGDFFLFTFAGHGRGIPDDPAPFGDEPDHQDETILLFDRMLIDDVMGHDLWPRFKPGVRVLVVSDSCQSGGIDEDAVITTTDVVTTTEVVASVSASEHVIVGDLAVAVTTGVQVSESVAAPVRTVSKETTLSHLASNHEFYEHERGSIPPMVGGASVLLLAACQDDESTPDAHPDDPDPHGAFTRALLKVWNGGAFVGDYDQFITTVGQELAATGLSQTPAVTPARLDNLAFRAQRPFVI